MKITKTKLRKIINEELDAILDEAKKGDWPKKLKTGRFTRWCKEDEFPDGAGIGCAKAAMDSDDASTRGMATFYMNTVQPGGHDASYLKKEGCGDLEEGVKTLLDQVKKDLGGEATDKEVATELERRAMLQADRLEEDTIVVDDVGANTKTAGEVINSMDEDNALDETGMSGYEGPDLPPEAMEELVTAVLHALRRMGFMKKEVPPEEKDA